MRRPAGTSVGSVVESKGISVINPVVASLAASLPLTLGGTLGAFWKPPRKLIALTLAFAAGALISAVAFELFEKSYESGGVWRSGLSFAAGAIVFVVIDTVLDRVTSSGGAVVGYALLAGVTLDGVPENIALGVSLSHSSSIALLVAIFVSNFPESLSGAAEMRSAGRSRRFVVSIWVVATLLLAAAVLAGFALFQGASPDQLALPLAFAGGAVLASVIDTLAPQAYEEGGPYIALATVAGFITAFLLAH